MDPSADAPHPTDSAEAVVPARRFLGRFTTPQLHSLAGVVPVASFVFLHLVTQATALGGHARYGRTLTFVQRIPAFALVEIVFIFAPLMFHAGYGAWLASRPAGRTAALPDQLQRVTALVTLAFVGLHLWEFRVQKWFYGQDDAFLFTKLAAHLSWTWHGVPLIAMGYLVGVAATAFHLADGLARASVIWGYTPARISARRTTLVCRAMGAIVFLLGAATIIGVATGSRLLPSGEDPMTEPCGSAAVDNPK